MKQNFVDIYYRCIKMGDKRVMTVNRIISKLGITRKTFYNWIGKYGEPGRRSAPE
jgi:predicted DNA-binding transcriptional regulator AlpA